MMFIDFYHYLFVVRIICATKALSSRAHRQTIFSSLHAVRAMRFSLVLDIRFSNMLQVCAIHANAALSHPCPRIESPSLAARIKPCSVQ